MGELYKTPPNILKRVINSHQFSVLKAYYTIHATPDERLEEYLMQATYWLCNLCVVHGAELKHLTLDDFRIKWGFEVEDEETIGSMSDEQMKLNMMSHVTVSSDG